MPENQTDIILISHYKNCHKRESILLIDQCIFLITLINKYEVKYIHKQSHMNPTCFISSLMINNVIFLVLPYLYNGKHKSYKIVGFQLPDLLPVTAPTEPPQLPGKCPESKGHKSWVPFHGHCYYFEATRKKSWSQAHQECMRLGEYCVLERLKMQ